MLESLVSPLLLFLTGCRYRDGVLPLVIVEHCLNAPERFRP